MSNDFNLGKEKYDTLNKHLLKGFMLIEDKEWKKANKCFDGILEQDIQCSDAYIGKLLIELCLANKEDLFETYCNLEKTITLKEPINLLMKFKKIY